MHHVLPLRRPMLAHVGFDLAELRGDVAGVGLEHELRQEARTHRQQFAAEHRAVLDLRRPQALEHVGVGLQRHDDELLQLPVGLLRRLVVDLLGHAEQRPVQFGRRQEHAAAVGVAARVLEAVGARTDDDAQDHAFEQGRAAELGAERRAREFAILVARQRRQLVAAQRQLGAVDEAHPIRMLQVVRRLQDRAERAARNAHAAGVTAQVRGGHHLRADRQDRQLAARPGHVTSRSAGSSARRWSSSGRRPAAPARPGRRASRPTPGRRRPCRASPRPWRARAA